MNVIPRHRSAPEPDPLVVVVGPTASGKTALGVDLALALDGEVVNGDSVLVYRGMDIGSATPTEAERRGVPHHVMDVWDVSHEATVAEFQALARAAVADVSSRGRVPVLVGGSSLYVRAVIDPLEFPGTDPQVRARWQGELDRIGGEALHAVLATRDPAAAEVLLPSNGRRIVRALEVIELTGRPFVAQMPPYVSDHPSVVMVGIDVDRDTVDARIRDRVDAMWAAGFVDEVRGLVGLAESPTASRAVGYQQVLAFLDGRIDEDTARAETVRATRKLARRQDRMMRKDPRITWLAPGPDLAERALAVVRAAGHPVG